jgi:hypothetical protein
MKLIIQYRTRYYSSRNLEYMNILYIVKERAILSSERAPHINKPATVRKNLVLSPEWVLDTKTDWPTDRRS